MNFLEKDKVNGLMILNHLFTTDTILPPNYQGVSCFALMLNFLYYFALSPFKVACGESGEYILKCNRFQKVICAAIHLLGIALVIPFLSRLLDSISLKNTDISEMLDLIGNLSSSAGVIFVIKTLWIDRTLLLEFLEACRIANYKNLKIKMTALCVYTGILHVCCTSYAYFAIGFTPPRKNDLIATVINTVADALSDYTGWTPPDYIWEWTLLPIYEICVFLATSLYTVSRLMIMGLCLTYKKLGETFEEFLEKENSIKEISLKFDTVRNAIGKGNRWVNELVICHYVGILSFLAYVPALRDSLSSSIGGVPLFRWYLVYTYGVFAIFIGIVCDLPNRIRNSWINWIARKRLDSSISLNDRFLMVLLAIEVETAPLGLSCSFFTITFNFLGSMVGLVVTYGIIVYQVKQ